MIQMGLIPLFTGEIGSYAGRPAEPAPDSAGGWEAPGALETAAPGRLRLHAAGGLRRLATRLDHDYAVRVAR